jgi:DNA-directed RNA polymerase specialized sigma24 family protein
VKEPDPWGAAEATAATATVKFCITCSEPFTRLYTNINGRPRLRDLKRWSSQRVLYCSKQSCAIFRRNKRNAGWLSLPAHSASLEPTPTLQPKMRSAARTGRPPTVTGRLALAKAERASAVMAQRLEGGTFREIALTQGLSTATVHRLFWKVVSENPPSRRRQRAALERAALSDDPASG